PNLADVVGRALDRLGGIDDEEPGIGHRLATAHKGDGPCLTLGRVDDPVGGEVPPLHGPKPWPARRPASGRHQSRFGETVAGKERLTAEPARSESGHEALDRLAMGRGPTAT